VTTATVGRPRTPLDLANAQALARIASLAAQVLVSLRQRGHGQYDSERRLASYLSDVGISFTTADLAPALTQLVRDHWTTYSAGGPQRMRLAQDGCPRPQIAPCGGYRPPGVESETAEDSTALCA
jgi:hypothetical protein